MKTSTVPKDLGPSGRALWRWVTQQGDISGTEPLVAELCRLQDRLAELRALLAKDGAVLRESGRIRKHPAADLEPKISGQFRQAWKLLGLADPPPAERRPVGRPPAGER
jgi:hypothetical protein